MSGWQDVETAPKDGTYILVFCPDAAEITRIMICAFEMTAHPDDAGDWYELNADTRPSPLDVEITHWMPLPEPPAAAEPAEVSP